MTKSYSFESPALFEQIKILSNPARFKIYEISKNNSLNETEISKLLKIKYKRVSEAIRRMELAGLVYTTKRGRVGIVKRKAVVNIREIV